MKGYEEKIIKEIDLIVEKVNQSGRDIEDPKIGYYIKHTEYLGNFNLVLQLVEKYSPPNSSFRRVANGIVEDVNLGNLYSIYYKTLELVSVLNSIKFSYQNGLFGTIEEFVRADTFNDFLEMCEYLLDNGYKDAAAVLVGSVLEQHQKKLALKNSIPLTKKNKKGDTIDKKNNDINDELKKENIYNSIEHTQIMAWLDIRNHAAHGEWTEYNIDQVKSMLSGVREYIIRNPA